MTLSRKINQPKSEIISYNKFNYTKALPFSHKFQLSYKLNYIMISLFGADNKVYGNQTEITPKLKFGWREICDCFCNFYFESITFKIMT